MKKAKVILTAIVLLGVVGGALAFKARTTHKLYCTTTNSPICTFETLTTLTTVAPNSPNAFETSCTTTSIEDACTTWVKRVI